MMFLRKNAAIMLMKFLSVLLLVFMIASFINIMMIDDIEVEIEIDVEKSLSNTNKAKSILSILTEEYKNVGKEENPKLDLCDRYGMLYLYVFALGGIWNLKQIQRMGVL